MTERKGASELHVIGKQINDLLNDCMASAPNLITAITSGDRGSASVNDPSVH